MGYQTYQNKAWEIMKKKLDSLAESDAKSNLSYKDMQELMSESASEAFRKPTDTKEIADLLMDAINLSSFDKDEFAKQVTERTHRTLQQDFFLTIMRCIEQWSQHHIKEMYDARNDYTVKTSRDIVNALKEN